MKGLNASSRPIAALKHDDSIVELTRLVSQISRDINYSATDAQQVAGLICAQIPTLVDSAISRSQSSETVVSRRCCPALVWTHQL